MKTGFYNGVSCVMTGQEARWLLRSYRALSPSDRLLMVGVSASTKSLYGLPVKKPRRFVDLSDLPEIFTPDPLALNIIHFATDDLSTLALQLIQVAAYAGPNLHGFQLNTDWPEIGQLQAVRKAFKDIRLIMNLAVPMNGLKKAGYSSVDAAGVISSELNSKSYNKFLTDVLIDVSGGKGVELDPKTAESFVTEIKKRVPWANVGVAGGLGPSNILKLDGLFAADEELNVDAESALRTEDDDLDLEVTRDYLMNLLMLFSM